MDLLAVLAAVAAMAAVLWWLARANARDRAALARRLGLREVAGGAAERMRAPFRGRATQRVILEGRLHGVPAQVWLRTVRRADGHRAPARSQFTVLSVEVPGSTQRFRLSPARTGAVAAAIGADWPERPTGDAAFDRAFRLSSPAPEAAACFPPEVRARWLALREALGAPLGPAADADAAGRFATDLLTGTLVLDHGRLEYAAMGSVTPGLIEHLARAAPEVAALAQRLGAPAQA